MARYFYDIETNGLIQDVSTIHSIVLQDMDDRSRAFSACDRPYESPNGHKLVSINEALEMMANAEELCGHNILSYDELVLRKLRKWNFPVDKMTDTMVLSRLGWPDMRTSDFAFIKRFRKGRTDIPSPIPGELIGSHKLKAWGYRLKIFKGSFAEEADWSKWTAEMQEYCEQDVTVTAAIYDRCRVQFERKGISIALEDRPEYVSTEHHVQFIVGRQMAHGFLFDVKSAEKLEAELTSKYAKLQTELIDLFPPWWSKDKLKSSKRTRRTWTAHELGAEVRSFKKTKTKPARTERGFYVEYEEGVTYTGIKLNVFNPTSRQMITNRLQTIYGWVPEEFTDSGLPKVDDTILSNMEYPPAASLAELFMLDKRLGMLATGKQAWLKAVNPDGRIRGYVNTLGAVTARMTHSFPNVAQVPSIANAKGIVPYGKDCRALFTVPPGKKLVGGDASSLELVCLAHYMGKYDDGEYAVAVSSGSKEEGTDPHTLNQKAAGLPSRDNAKTFIYAFLYGAGDLKIGTIVDRNGNEKSQKAAGRKLKERFLAKTPALDMLIKAVKKRAGSGYITALDGRSLPVRHQHAALNTLLQSAGAIIMKKALVILDEDLQTLGGLVPGKDYEFVANVHDEFQIEVTEEYADFVGAAIVRAIEKTGEHFNLRCPVTGDYDIGNSWAETH